MVNKGWKNVEKLSVQDSLTYRDIYTYATVGLESSDLYLYDLCRRILDNSKGELQTADPRTSKSPLVRALGRDAKCEIDKHVKDRQLHPCGLYVVATRAEAVNENYKGNTVIFDGCVYYPNPRYERGIYVVSYYTLSHIKSVLAGDGPQHSKDKMLGMIPKPENL